LVSRGIKHDSKKLSGFIAESDKQKIGICLYKIEGNECEIVVLESYVENSGVGTSLLNKVIENRGRGGYSRIWLITTNDNIDAMWFYQRRGFRKVRTYKNEIAKSRLLKPEIPLIGNHGIEIRDEIELELIYAENFTN
jgi:ribosomal protein S18 acetylase RimI-like enzyme